MTSKDIAHAERMKWARTFISSWLWGAPNRKTRGQSWPVDHIEDAAEMILEAVKETRDQLQQVGTQEIERLREVIARCYLRLQAADVPREPWHWEVSTALDDTGLCSPPETTPVIVGWAVGDLHGAPAMYNINEFDRASDAARRWGKPITGLVQAPNTPTFAPRPYSSEETSEPTTCLGLIRDGICSCGHHRGDGWRCVTCGHENPPRVLRCQNPACTAMTNALPEKASEPRELTASEAASFSKTLARSPRVLEKAGARPTPQQLGERHADTLRALAEDVCKCRGKLGWTRDESGKAICTDCRLPITHPEKAKPAHTCKHGNDWLACKLCDGEAVKAEASLSDYLECEEHEAIFFAGQECPHCKAEKGRKRLGFPRSHERKEDAAAALGVMHTEFPEKIEAASELHTCYSRTGLEGFIARHFPDSYLAPRGTATAETPALRQAGLPPKTTCQHLPNQAHWCPVCGSKDGEHKRGCVDGDVPL